MSGTASGSPLFQVDQGSPGMGQVLGTICDKGRRGRRPLSLLKLLQYRGQSPVESASGDNSYGTRVRRRMPVLAQNRFSTALLPWSRTIQVRCETMCAELRWPATAPGREPGQPRWCKPPSASMTRCSDADSRSLCNLPSRVGRNLYRKRLGAADMPASW
jgi:hypothetical protein